VITQTLFWCSFAVLLAAFEIEIEGKYGWAEKLPTWYRTRGAAARVFGLLASGKPLTGYHLFLNAIVLLSVHAPFLGTVWTPAQELVQLAFFLLLWVFEDAAWFILNPHYGLNQFRKDRVWWFAKSTWIEGVLPLDHVIGGSLTLVLLATSGIIGGGEAMPALRDAAQVIGVALMLLCFVAMAAPFYRIWYRRMRETDDRDKAGIFHRD
jgi:hypothetical protein